jgi:hypothetical protein
MDGNIVRRRRGSVRSGNVRGMQSIFEFILVQPLRRIRVA